MLFVPVAQSINLGKIAAIFYYCYSLCKAFVRRTFMGNTLVQLICTLGGYLIATFVRVKFYQWLEGIGGWVSVATIWIFWLPLVSVSGLEYEHKLTIYFIFNFRIVC